MTLISEAAASPLYTRSRPAGNEELGRVPWLSSLDRQARARVVADLRVVRAERGEFICRIGRPAGFWLGLVDGLLKMHNEGAPGESAMTFAGISPGGWFGEGTLLKHEVYRYNIQALRASIVAGISVRTFDWLLGHSIEFNRFLMNQLNERLGQFIAAREIDRLTQPDARVARSLAALFDPVLYPRVGPVLRVTQQELAYLIGLSRQRVNEALRRLHDAGLIAVEYGGVRLLDLERLRRGDLGAHAPAPGRSPVDPCPSVGLARSARSGGSLSR